ncbi:isocitrate lyase/PEP mutase family protein [Paraburkholderia sp. J12]|uniref:isocitrate lyase/PEP mutase family protein n=1 Tax=Paraburkholderia sp. J12 TaxID=2805432 RepID=UPI002ABD8FDF|nr:isocitrate lyase/PEP mutase family protein [Paraburkholderia sp. J12]
MNNRKTSQFKEYLHNGKATLIPGAYDALSTKLVDQAGFEGVYIGSYATAASGFGLPDVGLLNLTDIADYAARLAAATDLPVLADGEAGFSDAPNIWRTIRAFEKAGVAGIHIEDNLGGKHTDAPVGLIDAKTMATKIRAAVDAKTDPDFTVIARSDAVWVNHDLEDCVSRLQRYQDAGADAVFAPGLTAKQLSEIRHRLSVPVMVLGDLPDRPGEDVPSSNLSDYAESGADLIVLFYLTLGAAAKGVRGLLEDLSQNRDIRTAIRHTESTTQFESGMGYAEYVQRARQYRG